MKRHLIVTLLLAAVASGAGQTLAASGDSLDAIARDYVLLSLTIGEKEEGYIDSYYGPAELQAKAKADAAGEDFNTLASRTSALSQRIEKLRDVKGMDARRAKFLAAQLTAATTRLKMLRGEKLSFADEAEGLFALRLTLKPLASYEPILKQIDAMLPRNGPLDERVQAFQEAFTIPPDKQKQVFDAAIAECKARTAQHIVLPKGENGARLKASEAELYRLQTEANAPVPKIVDLQPCLESRWRTLVEGFESALKADEIPRARAGLRAITGEIQVVATPKEIRLETQKGAVEGALLRAAGGQQTFVVAGAGFEPATFGL